jgi:hypothetical protein
VTAKSTKRNRQGHSEAFKQWFLPSLNIAGSAPQTHPCVNTATLYKNYVTLYECNGPIFAT